MLWVLYKHKPSAHVTTGTAPPTPPFQKWMIQPLEKAQAFCQQLTEYSVIRTESYLLRTLYKSRHPTELQQDSLIESHLFAAVSGRAKVAATMMLGGRRRHRPIVNSSQRPRHGQETSTRPTANRDDVAIEADLASPPWASASCVIFGGGTARSGLGLRSHIAPERHTQALPCASYTPS